MEGYAMTMTMNVDTDLLDKAEVMSGLTSKDAVVDAALKEYIRIQNLKEFRKVRGTVEFDPDWDYKKMRGKV
jgi:Arc/MetJ family transcription regulator